MVIVPPFVCQQQEHPHFITSTRVAERSGNVETAAAAAAATTRIGRTDRGIVVCEIHPDEEEESGVIVHRSYVNNRSILTSLQM